ncbi:MAG: UDP-N-acetylglucosamine 2-epimerase (non-hydrolyzing) [Gemmatimonadota bacterium]|nr:MAG: UDP-N-acetylglucosamine 2-epimerase (non-hydrolyzing) [Gemmatimonadota bacterium]
MKHVLVVFGTRPEAIKLCPLVLELKQHPSDLKTTVCVTAQHREMLDQVLEIFDVRPDYDLDLMRQNQSLAYVTSHCLNRIGETIDRVLPDILLVQGDTTTSFAASLAAYYNKVPVGHVEAGLRTYDKYSPFPEEINRRLTSAIADVHFAPTGANRDNLLREGVSPDSIVVTGNTVIDALFWVRQKVRANQRKYADLSGIDPRRRMILITGHRRENFGTRFAEICRAFKWLAERHPDTEIVYPVHLNPNVRRPVHEILAGVENIRLIEPVDYELFVYLMDRSYFIISDSGGIQEEAPSLGKPVLVTRDTTERPEAVAAGAVKLVGADPGKILVAAELLLSNHAAYSRMANVENPSGDGQACRRIAESLLHHRNTIT